MKIDDFIDFEKLLLLNYKKLDLTDDEALLLLITHSIVQNGTKFVNPNDLSYYCSFSNTKIDVIYSSLTSKGFISTEMKDDGSVFTSFEKTNQLLLNILQKHVEEVKHGKEEIDVQDMFKYMEGYFGRLLTPLEYEVIQTWKNKGYKYNLIKAASEIAAQSGNKSIRYIDTIIFEEAKKEELGVEEYSKRQQETVELAHVDWLNK